MTLEETTIKKIIFSTPAFPMTSITIKFFLGFSEVVL